MGPRCALLALLTALAAAPSGVQARDARAHELLTPRGWEETPSSASDMALPDDELVVPVGWRSARPCQTGMQNGGDFCSELLVPADWSALLRERAAGPHA